MTARLTRLDVRGYQSLADVSVPLGALTVIEGESNTGKSAIMRALRHLAVNSGRGDVTRGAKTCSVALVEADREAGTSLAVVLRSHAAKSATGKDTYRVLHSGPDGAGQAEFGKLGGKVPDEVSRVLALGSLNFAGQFDPPFLVAGVTGTEIARTLGELTNVTMVFQAARAAENERQRAARDLAASEARLEQLAAEARAYRGVKEQRRAIAAAEEALPALEAARRDLARFRALAARAAAQREKAERARAAAAAAAPPDLSRLEELLATLERFRDLTAKRGEAEARARWERDQAGVIGRAIDGLHVDMHQLLADAGTCPTCGQEIAA